MINSSVIEKKDLKDGVFSSISKSVALALFWVVIGLCPVSGFQPHAIALPAISDILWRKKGKIVKEEPPLVSWKEHEFSGYTQRLLDCVSDVLKVMKEVRVGESGVKELEDALERVKLKKKELQKEIMGGLHAELKVLKENKQKLGVRAREVFRDVMKAKNVQDTLLDELRITRGNDPWTEGDKEKLNRAVESLDSVEKDYNELQDMIGEIEDLISKRETLCLSIGVSELMFIEDECEGLVRRFIRETRHNAR